MSDPVHNPVESAAGHTDKNADEAALYPTPLAASLAGPSLTLGEYRGAPTVEAFSSSQEEVAAMLCAAGVYDLGWRSFLRCSGRDRERWLNGMVTNSVKTLEENAGCYAFVLNAQGRIQGDLDIYRLGKQSEVLWLQTDRAQLASLTAFVRRYIIMDQVALEPENSWTAIGLAGPHAAEILTGLGLPGRELSPTHLTETSWHGKPVVVVAAFSPGVSRYELWIESQFVLDLWKAITSGGAIPCGTAALEQLRIFEGIPAYGVDIADRDLPQETNQERALNFAKGCYLGQEIVERIRSRGNVHRTISGFLLEQSGPVAKSPIIADGKPVGELTSVAAIVLPDLGQRVVALGHLRREALDGKETLTVGGIHITPCQLPFDFICTTVQP